MTFRADIVINEWYKPSDKLPKNGEEVYVKLKGKPYIRSATFFTDNGHNPRFKAERLDSPVMADEVEEWTY